MLEFIHNRKAYKAVETFPNNQGIKTVHIFRNGINILNKALSYSITEYKSLTVFLNSQKGIKLI